MTSLPRHTVRAASIIGALLLIGRPAAAQSLAQRVSRVSDGIVHFSFAARSEVCGDGENSIRVGDNNHYYSRNWSDGSREWEHAPCEPGPVRVSLHLRGGQPVALRTYVGGRWRSDIDSVTDLGTVGVREAVDYLFTLTGDAQKKVAGNAIFATIIADSVVVWPRLLAIARDEAKGTEARRQATFWLSQAAGDAATAGLDSLASDRAVDRDVREQAVFALSQRPKDEGVPVLIRLARSDRDPAIRRKAIFWLGQSNDPRALALFEQLLTGK